jgi:hypothetical protein
MDAATMTNLQLPGNSAKAEAHKLLRIAPSISIASAAAKRNAKRTAVGRKR